LLLEIHEFLRGIFNDASVLIEIAIPNPGGPGPEIRNALPFKSVASIGESVEIDFSDPFEFVSSGFVGNPFVLQSGLATVPTTNDDSDSCGMLQVLPFP